MLERVFDSIDLSSAYLLMNAVQSVDAIYGRSVPICVYIV